MVLAQIGVQRVGARLRPQSLQHHVLAPTFGEMLAIGLAKAANARVAVLLVDAASRVTMSAVQTFPSHLTLPCRVQFTKGITTTGKLVDRGPSHQGANLKSPHRARRAFRKWALVWHHRPL